MATDHESNTNCSINGDSEDDEFIDMEVSCSSSPLSYSINGVCCSSPSSHLQNREFEFQMSSSLLHQNPQNKNTDNTSPADELFYKGNLLPLHLPPRLQLVQSLLLQSSASAAATAAVTPVNISPSGSGRVSSELNPDEYLWSAGGGRFLSEEEGRQSKKPSWGKKLRQSVIKSSRSYLKALLLFPTATTTTTKSDFQNDESFGKHIKTESSPSAEEAGKRDCFISKFPRVGRKKSKGGNSNPFGRIENYERFEYSSTLKKRIEKEMAEECLGFSSNRNSISISTSGNYISGQQRKSFSGAIQCHVSSTKSSSNSSSSSSSASSTTSSSSSFSLSSDKLYYDLLWLKKGGSSDGSKEIESSIEGAIAHCKKSRDDCSSKGAQLETPKMCV
ncbi:Probable membrane-associated kinase regulator 3 [Linum perenne]